MSKFYPNPRGKNEGKKDAQKRKKELEKKRKKATDEQEKIDASEMIQVYVRGGGVTCIYLFLPICFFAR